MSIAIGDEHCEEAASSNFDIPDEMSMRINEQTQMR